MTDHLGHTKAGVNPWLVAPVVAVAAFMEVLDISIANVSLQHLAGDLSAGQDEATWILTSYLVTNAIVLPISGWLSQVMGRQRFFLACIVGFSISSLACGMAPTLPALIAFRAIQGLTGGGLQPVAQAILTDTFPPRQRGMAFALYGMSVVFAPAIGPTLGGWITDTASWRWVFLLNVPVGVLLFMLVTAMVEDPPAFVRARLDAIRRGAKVDFVGLILVALGLGLLQVVLDRGEQEDWFASASILAMSIASVVALVSFVIWELGQKDPVVDLHLLRDRNFSISNLLMFLLGFVLLGSTVLLPEMLQRLFGYTATLAGLVITPGGLSIMLLMPLVGRLSSSVDPRHLIAFGLVVVAVGLFRLGLTDLATDYTTFMWARIVQAMGLAFLFIPINTAAFRNIPPEKSGAASALTNVARNLGGSVGISVVTTLLSRSAQIHQSHLVAHATSADAAYVGLLDSLTHRFLAAGGSEVEANAQALGQIYEMVRQQALMLSFIDDFRFMAMLFLLLVPFVYLMRKPLPHAAHPPAGH